MRTDLQLPTLPKPYVRELWKTRGTRGYEMFKATQPVWFSGNYGNPEDIGYTVDILRKMEPFPQTVEEWQAHYLSDRRRAANFLSTVERFHAKLVRYHAAMPLPMKLPWDPTYRTALTIATIHIVDETWWACLLEEAFRSRFATENPNLTVRFATLREETHYAIDIVAEDSYSNPVYAWQVKESLHYLKAKRLRARVAKDLRKHQAYKDKTGLDVVYLTRATLETTPDWDRLTGKGTPWQRVR